MTEATSTEDTFERIARRCSLGASAAVALLALAVLLGGWLAGWSVLIRIRPDFSAMVPSTAASLLVLAVALIVYDRKGGAAPGAGSVVLRLVAGLVATVSLANLAILVTGAADGIDALVWPDIPGESHNAQAPATSLCFLLAAASTYRLPKAPRNDDKVFTGCATAGLLLSLIAVVGYAFDSDALYAVSIFTAMALHTAVGFVALFGALLLLRPRIGWVGLLLGSGGGSAGARRVFPITILGSLALCLAAYFATEAGLFTANFRLSLLAILIMALLAAAVLRNAVLENRAESKVIETVAELRVSLADRDLLLRELNHRVKNNLQQIMALIWFQSESVSDRAAKDAFRDTVGRIQTLSAVHLLLLAGPGPSQIHTEGFFEELCESIAAAYGASERKIDIEVQIVDTELHIDVAITLGLLVNELVSNAIKHAFPSGGGGKIIVGFGPVSDGKTVLTISDNGIGQPATEGVNKPGKGVGMQIVDGLIAQLRAEIAWSGDDGTTVTVTVPEGFERRGSHS